MLMGAARTVQIQHASGLTLSYQCGNHGPQAARPDDPAAAIDASTPVRTVLRSLCFARDRSEQTTETIVLDGDWAGAWMQRVYFDGLHRLGYSGTQVPFNIFTPRSSTTPAPSSPRPSTSPGTPTKHPASMDLHTGICYPLHYLEDRMAAFHEDESVAVASDRRREDIIGGGWADDLSPVMM